MKINGEMIYKFNIFHNSYIYLNLEFSLNYLINL